MTKPLLHDDFSSLPVGPLPTDWSAKEEYHFFPPQGENGNKPNYPLPVKALVALFLPDERTGKPKPAARLVSRMLGLGNGQADGSTRTTVPIRSEGADLNE